MKLKWRNADETVMYGLGLSCLDEQVSTSEGLAHCTMYIVPEAWYTGAFIGMFDLLYGPNAPINAKFPQLALFVDDKHSDGSSLAILGEHKLWEKGDPMFEGSVFFHFPSFYNLKTNLIDLQMNTAHLIRKHKALMPWLGKN